MTHSSEQSSRGLRRRRLRGLRRRRLRGLRRRWLAGAAALVWLALAAPAMADPYDEKRAGHPLRIVAYIVHPVGVALDYLIFRPVHWVGTHEPFLTIFGHREEF